MASPSLSTRMTSMDASFLYFERPAQPLHIGSTCILEGTLSREEMVAHMRRRMHRIPRYRQRAMFDSLNLAHPSWEDDPAFDVERHITEVSLPEGATDADVKRAIAGIFAPMLPRDRPLWRMILLQGMPGGRTGLTSLVHHCMVDGVSGIELLAAIADLAPDVPPDPDVEYVPARPVDPVTRATQAWRELLRSGFELSSQSLNWALDPQQQVRDLQTVNRALGAASPALVRPAPPTPWNRPVTGQRTYESLAMSFGEIRGVRGALGGTINDVVLSTLAGGLGRYLRGRGVNTAGLELRAMVPVNVRAEAEQSALGNQVSLLIAALPVGIVDPVERHTAVMGEMNRLKEANQAGGFALLTRLSDLVPPAVQAMAGMMVPNGQTLFNLVCTNVPGPQIPLYIAGRKMEEHWPLVPVSAGLGMNVALTSYNGVLYWGICADPNLVPDIDVAAESIRESFEELKAAAMRAAPAA